VYGVDVGYGQVAWKLRQDERVILKERTNLRYLEPETLYGEATRPDLAVLDLSFISLTKVLQPLWNLLIPPREVVLLVKPQFEVGRDRVGEKGVVRSANDHHWGIMTVLRAAQVIGWSPQGLTWSPIRGPAGNIEYLLWLASESRSNSTQTVNDCYVETITKTACKELNSRAEQLSP
jgi:23S rRNA (cytidine1920-2'-O)/16S rRNA (cytidine1409-2'-O)-methyltransferase